jgi:tRNA dimethylallyltransferase
MPAHLIIICGPTATGKSDLAVELALALGGEIINADSMQLYTGMDIGTAKLPLEQRKGIPHHLLDILSVREDASVAAYQKIARQKIDQIRSEGKSAIVVGGTGLYIKSIIDEMNFPDTDPAIRARLESEAEEFGSAALFSKLQELDPEAASKIEPANTRRVIRALEVIEATGQPFSANLPSDTSVLYPDAFHFGLSLDRELLASRIDFRVHRMWEAGLTQEVVSLLKEGLREGSTACRAIGYSQAMAHLDGEMSGEEAIASTITATRQYVRRQETWFKRDQRIQWIAPEQSPLEAILDKLNS